ncbi:MAG: ribosome biogenesis GTP-binding protein YihA/YsxC [Prevotellaceae bacterium]|nr:ribosome biogenesis GTP-binding protein YihA/YsxC [Prevotellaceae bacterium]
MFIKEAKFICSSSTVSQCPKADLREYAFIGRSNVGKSSLINMLTGQKVLAKVSSQPGKTKLINHFLVNNKWYLVDLPGYGYARTSKKERSIFSVIISDYIAKRENLTLLFVLVDSRLEPQKIDIEFINKLGEHQVPLAIAFTKTDKLTKRDWDINIDRYKKTLLEYWEEPPPIFLTSAEKGSGKDELLSYIDSINRQLDG